MDRLIVGLGNYGRQYQHTRHNIGWDTFLELSFANELRWQEKFKGHYAVYTHKSDKIYFLKPQTYMNLSGESVIALVQFYKLELENIFIVHDELDLPYGTIAFKKGGGLAGHNGLKSIAQHLGTTEFKRIRIGIGRPIHGSVSDWVLSSYAGEEKDFFPHYMKACALALENCIQLGFDKAATTYSKKKLI